MSEQHAKQISFWKKHQTLLQKCADLSKKCGVKIMCVITVPDRYSRENGGQHNLRVDNRTGDMHLRNTCGTTVVFDSFSPSHEVRRRNPVMNSVSKLNDTSRHFLVNMNVCVTSPVVAVLDEDSVAEYRTVDRKVVEPIKTPPVAKRTHVVTEFDLEIERRKRQCAMLFSDMPTHPPPPKPRFLSMAEALLSMNPPNTFAHALCNPSEMPSCCAQRRATPQSSEEIAVSALREFGKL